VFLLVYHLSTFLELTDDFAHFEASHWDGWNTQMLLQDIRVSSNTPSKLQRGCYTERQQILEFLEPIDNHKCSQVVEFPTHKEVTLDLLLTNWLAFLEKIDPVPGFGDH